MDKKEKTRTTVRKSQTNSKLPRPSKSAEESKILEKYDAIMDGLNLLLRRVAALEAAILKMGNQADTTEPENIPEPKREPVSRTIPKRVESRNYYFQDNEEKYRKDVEFAEHMDRIERGIFRY